jgi:nucleotide-binding universal stress UspA family protein
MKLLIAYDGSKDAEAAIDDLTACGLPREGSAEVISVAEVWLPPAEAVDEENLDGATKYLEEILRESRRESERVVAEAEMLAKYGANRTKVVLPEWDVAPVATSGSAGWEIVDEAQRFGADLILVGAQGHSFISRVVLGSISQRVLTEARCSVRIGRGRIDLDSGPQRILIGFDGSRGATAAVAAVAERNWTSGTEVSLVAVTEPAAPTSIGRFVTPIVTAVGDINVSERVWLERSAEAALELLKGRGLNARFLIASGNPKHTLVEEAENWGADCIFVGANAWAGRLERFLIGSTSAAVAARAHCSVEVVRARTAPAGSADGTGNKRGDR